MHDISAFFEAKLPSKGTISFSSSTHSTFDNCASQHRRMVLDASKLKLVQPVETERETTIQKINQLLPDFETSFLSGISEALEISPHRESVHHQPLRLLPFSLDIACS